MAVNSRPPGSETAGEIVLRGVGRSYVHRSGKRVDALREVSATIGRGEFVCAVGPSGHGKSTLLNLVAGLVEPTSGEVLMDGEPVRGPEWRRGMVFQQNAVFPWRRVADNVGYGLRCRGASKADIERVVAEYLRLVGLSEYADSWPRELSGGMLQRVAVATVFATDAEVLLMDEPFGALDYVTRARLQDILLDLWARDRKTVIFVTHDVEEAIRLADRMLIIREGGLADDFRLELPRPRDEDVMATPPAVEARKRILGHLGLEARVHHEEHDGAAPR